MQSPWKVITAFIGVFVAGAVFGGVFSFRAAKRAAHEQAQIAAAASATSTSQPATKAVEKAAPPPLRVDPRMMKMFSQRLNLTAEQQATVKPILARAEEDMNHLRRENLRATTRVMERMYVDVSATLSPEQKTQLENERQRLQKHMADEMKKGANPQDAFRNSQKAEKGEKAPLPAKPTSE